MTLASDARGAAGWGLVFCASRSHIPSVKFLGGVVFGVAPHVEITGKKWTRTFFWNVNGNGREDGPNESFFCGVGQCIRVLCGMVQGFYLIAAQACAGEKGFVGGEESRGAEYLNFFHGNIVSVLYGHG